MTEPTWLELCPAAANRDPWVLDVGRFRVVEHLGSFEAGMPAGWSPDQPDCWSVEAGRLCASVAGENATFLWRDEPLRGNHAIRYRGAAIPAPGEPPDAVSRNGNLNCIWDSRSKIAWSATPPNLAGDAWAMTVSGFAGWWSGLTGIEYLRPEGQPTPVGHGVSRFAPLVPGRVYDLIAGRYEDRDFLFIDGQLAMEVMAPGLPRPPESFVAVATFGTLEYPASIEVESITAYTIPGDALRCLPDG